MYPLNRDHHDKLTSLRRCYFDAEHGRVKLALERLSDLENEFGRDSKIIYTEADIRSNYLGQGYRAFQLFSEATVLESSFIPAIANAILFSPSASAFARFFDMAQEFFQQDTRLRMMCHTINQNLHQGLERWKLHIDAAQQYRSQNSHGKSAAFLEIVLGEENGNLSLEEEINYRRVRAESLRAIDNQAAVSREALNEHFPSDQRLALHQAIHEMSSMLTLDEFDAEGWNFMSAWHYLLFDNENAIRFADRAISLRSSGYAKPWINKALASWNLQDYTTATAYLNQAQVEAQRSDNAKDLGQINSIRNEKFVRFSISSLKNFEPGINAFVDGSIVTSNQESGQWQSSLDAVLTGLAMRLEPYGKNWNPEYILIMKEFLMDFTPESTAEVVGLLSNYGNHKQRYCLYAGIYLIVHSSSTLQRDASRFVAIYILSYRNANEIKEVFRRTIMEPSVASRSHFTLLEQIMLAEFARIHPSLPELIASQKPVDKIGRERACKSFLRLFDDCS